MCPGAAWVKGVIALSGGDEVRFLLTERAGRGRRSGSPRFITALNELARVDGGCECRCPSYAFGVSGRGEVEKHAVDG